MCRRPTQALVETSARRLQIAQQVALAKWDSGAAVEDVAREEQVIAAATKLGEARGLDKSLVQNFFRAQIEANKIVQYSLLADWRRVGKTPEHSPVDLTKTIRPELDQVQTELIAELADTSGRCVWFWNSPLPLRKSGAHGNERGARRMAGTSPRVSNGARSRSALIEGPVRDPRRPRICARPSTLVSLDKTLRLRVKPEMLA
jgi:chorismate mutase-like protein